MAGHVLQDSWWRQSRAEMLPSQSRSQYREQARWTATGIANSLVAATRAICTCLMFLFFNIVGIGAWLVMLAAMVFAVSLILFGTLAIAGLVIQVFGWILQGMGLM